jgi:plastocyanin
MRLPFLACAAAASLLLGLDAQAQTVHQVDLLTSTFSPKNLVIQAGDTVRWTWVNGFHNCVSGVSGTPDGIWDSGLFPAPFTFEVTFDQAFLAANPVPNNRYDYYCVVHQPGMTGSVTVQAPPAGAVIPYGSGINPAGSLLANGTPQIGKTLGIRLRNPDDPLAGPGVGALFIATSPAPGFPAGVPVPGFGLGPQSVGELLLSLTPPDPAVTLGPQTWFEGGNVDFAIPIPNDPSLVGRKLYAQGALIDTTVANPIGLTGAVELVIG